jgi:hypothetical protein
MKKKTEIFPEIFDACFVGKGVVKKKVILNSFVG